MPPAPALRPPSPIVPAVRGRHHWVVVAVTLLAVGIGASLPASAQTDDEQVTSTTEAQQSTSTTRFTLLPTTSTTELSTTTTTEDEATTTTEPTTATTEATTTTAPPVTVPRTTSTAEIELSPGPVELPTTTSLPPPAAVDEGLSPGTVVLLVISGLLLVALALGLFTWRFWLSTRPEVAAAPSSTVAEHG